MFEILQNNRDIVGWILIAILVVIIIIIGWCIFSKIQKSTFENKDENTKKNKKVEIQEDQNKEFENDLENIVELKEIFFIDRVGCPFSDKQRESLKNNNFILGDFKVRIIEIGSEEGQNLSKQYNIRGTPTLLNPENGVISVGAKSDQEHLSSLKNIKSEVNIELDESVLYVIGRNGCPFCLKMYNLLEENNIEYEKIESNSDKGRSLLEKYNSNGVPLLVKNDKTIIGFTDIENIKETFLNII